MGFMDFIKKTIVESDSKFLNSTLFKSNTDKLFDELYRLIKKYGQTDGYKHKLRFARVASDIDTMMQYTIDSIDVIRIIITDNMKKIATFAAIARNENGEYYYCSEDHTYNDPNEETIKISEYETLSSIEIEDDLIEQIKIIKELIAKKEECDYSFYSIYDYLREKKKLEISYENSLTTLFVSEECEEAAIFFQTKGDDLAKLYFDEMDYFVETIDGYIVDIYFAAELLESFSESVEKEFDTVKRDFLRGINFSKYNTAENIEIPSHVKKIESYAFCNQKKLRSITIPDSVTEIGERAFKGCSMLYSIRLPEGLKRIEPYTFYECSSLYSITIPESVEYIHKDAFYNCDYLHEVKFLGTKLENFEDCFFNNKRDVKFYIKKCPKYEIYEKLDSEKYIFY